MSVRLDLFLKTSRLIKRRAIAREMCEKGRVLVNNHEAKPAKEVKQGDVVTVTFSSRIIEVEITGPVSSSTRKTVPAELYRVKSDKRIPKDAELWSENHS